MKTRLSKFYNAMIEEWKYLLFYPIYLISFVLLERLGDGRSFHIIHCALDDCISFGSIWVIPYFLWHGLMIFLPFFLLLRDREALHRMIKFFTITYVMAFLTYLIYPSMQNIRPVLSEGGDFFTRICYFLYNIDTPTNICPSMHVIGCVGAIIGIWNTRPFDRPIPRITTIILCLTILLSTVFLRQHSFMDHLCAIPVICVGLLSLSRIRTPQLISAGILGEMVVLGLLFRDRLTIDNIISHSPKITGLAILFLLILFAAKSLSVVLPSAPLFIASGVLFDLPLAIIINIAGTVIMISLPYILGRFTGPALITDMQMSKKYSALKLLERARNKREFMYAFYLRSFKLLNYDLGSGYCGAIELKYLPYVGGSLAGILPEIVIYPLIGNGLFSNNTLPMIIGIIIEILLTIASVTAVCHLCNAGKSPDLGFRFRKHLLLHINKRHFRSIASFKNWVFRE